MGIYAKSKLKIYNQLKLCNMQIKGIQPMETNKICNMQIKGNEQIVQLAN